MNELERLEAEFSSLPKGSIVWKKTSKNSDDRKPYLQWREGQKTKSRYIMPDELAEISNQVQRRKELQTKILNLKKAAASAGIRTTYIPNLQMNVIYGNELKALIKELDYAQKDYVINKILDEIRGRMLEEIVLIECKKSLGDDFKVFKYQFLGGEYDMVIYNIKDHSCKIYEIKHSAEAIRDQCRHLLNEEKCHELEVRFGKINGKYVLYRGNNISSNWGIEYLNVSDFLKQLPDANRK